MNITLTQLSTLIKVLKGDENVTKHFDLEDNYEVWRKLEYITEKQYKYIYHLLISKKMFKLNEILINLGFKNYGK